VLVLVELSCTADRASSRARAGTRRSWPVSICLTPRRSTSWRGRRVVRECSWPPRAHTAPASANSRAPSTRWEDASSFWSSSVRCRASRTISHCFEWRIDGGCRKEVASQATFPLDPQREW